VKRGPVMVKIPRAALDRLALLAEAAKEVLHLELEKGRAVVALAEIARMADRPVGAEDALRMGRIARKALGWE
jgi:hypothetical protein